MNTLELLQNRKSTPAKCLTEPAPTTEEIELIIIAALAAPDHCALKPWEFIIIKGEARHRLGQLLAEASQHREPSLPMDKINRQKDKPLRSPMIIVVVAKIAKNHDKVPELEQLLSAGVAANQILLASNTLGYDGIWLSGPNAFEDSLKKGLGIETKDAIVGFIYLGTSTLKHNHRKPIDPKPFIRYL